MGKVDEYRKRRANRILSRIAKGCVEHYDDDGQWITTENGHHVHLNENGDPDKGNKQVIAAMKRKPSSSNEKPRRTIGGKVGVKKLQNLISSKKVFGPEHDDEKYYKKVKDVLDNLKSNVNIETRTTGDGEKLYHKNEDGSFDVYKYSDVNGEYKYLRTKKNISSDTASVLLGWEQIIYDFDPDVKI